MDEAPLSFRDGRYRTVRVLGEGAQATTYDAVDVQLGQPVAVKRFRVRGARSWKEVELAEREARVLAEISHPLLPRYIDHFEEGGELFLVTSKIEGHSLASLRGRGVTLGEEDVLRFLRDAADVLAYLHGRAPPIVHRDIKPGNVIWRLDGSFAFIDFGAVRDRMKPEGGSTVVGTFGYMAPEQFQGRALPASDVYAVGATALSLLTGREPEELPHKGLRLDVPAALAGSHVSPALVEVLSAMLEPDPDERPPAIAPLLDALTAAPKALPIEDENDPPRGSTWRYLIAVWMTAAAFLVVDGFTHSLRLAGIAAVLAVIVVFAPTTRRRRRRRIGQPRAGARIASSATSEHEDEDEDEHKAVEPRRRTRRL